MEGIAMNQKLKKWAKLSLGVLLAGSLLTGCGNGGATGDPAGRAAMDGEIETLSLYRQNCMSCHGNELQGRFGPNLQAIGSRMTEEELVSLIQDGKGGMPAFGNRLSKEDITTLAAWLAEQK